MRTGYIAYLNLDRWPCHTAAKDGDIIRKSQVALAVGRTTLLVEAEGIFEATPILDGGRKLSASAHLKSGSYPGMQPLRDAEISRPSASACSLDGP